MRSYLKSGWCFALLLACGDPEFLISPGQGGGASGGFSSNGGSGGQGTGNNFESGGNGPTTSSSDPCDLVKCDVGFVCEVEDGEGVCAPLDCEDLNCPATSECEVLPGGGAICVDNSCNEDVECEVAEYCDGEICQDDVCVGGQTECDGNTVLECAQNGSALVPKFECGGDAYFESTCVEFADGFSHCGCVDDWDCPAFTVCDVDHCIGTGVEPTCRLPAVPFSDSLPALEIQWGGTSEQQIDALGSPFPHSAQVVMTPLVANLDDDNGDGAINERDFPEIVFVTFCDQETNENGVLRAIHGGGPQKGQDYFAVCGNTVWNEGQPLPQNCASTFNTCAPGDVNSTAALALGDIDGDGRPEIVAMHESRGFTIYRNDGAIAYRSPINVLPSENYRAPSPTLANLDNVGHAELVIGRFVFTFETAPNGSLNLVDTFQGNLMNGTQNYGPTVCLANLVGDTRQEIVAGTTAYSFPRAPVGAVRRSDCAANPPSNAEETAYCNGQLVVAWDGQTVNGAALIPNAVREGFCAVADILGENEQAAPGPLNPLDGTPEVILINEGTLIILDGATGTRLRNVALGAGQDGGAPNVDDFDGDGFPEIGSAFGVSYRVLDLQDTSATCPAWNIPLDDGMGLNGPQLNPPRTPPSAPCTTDADCSSIDASTTCNEETGSCICLHNSWRRLTEDDSSRVTGSSVFDFNGDGAAEVVYNDECFFRVYDGLAGGVYFREPSESRTRIEYPVVADIDNDGNAEIVFSTSNESGHCSIGDQFNYSNGLEVWGDPTDTWVSARRMWSEHAYHVTNVTEGGQIPVIEPESWREYNGRLYNTYRSNPRSNGVAPDLTVSGIQFTTDAGSCGALGDEMTITFQLDNLGDLRVGPGIIVEFDGTWTGLGLTERLAANPAGDPLQVVIANSLEPGESVILSVGYDANNNDPGVLPDSVRVIVDPEGQARECNEGNNSLEEDVAAPSSMPDLVLDITGITTVCPPTVSAVVTNAGTEPASGVVVRFYAGDPNQGGAPIQDVAIPGTIGPGESRDITELLSEFPSSALSITVYGIVDPDQLIAECNDGNNKAFADDSVSCAPE